MVRTYASVENEIPAIRLKKEKKIERIRLKLEQLDTISRLEAQEIFQYEIS